MHSKALALLLLAVGCSNVQRPTEAPQGTVSVPNPSGQPADSQWRAPAVAVVSERNRCVDTELSRRELNEFGEPKGTVYPEGRPLGVTGTTDRIEYVLQRNPGIRTMCSRAPGEPVR